MNTWSHLFFDYSTPLGKRKAYFGEYFKEKSIDYTQGFYYNDYKKGGSKDG